MTPEQIAEVRQQASVNYLVKVQEAAMQIGMSCAADCAQLQAQLQESQKLLTEANEKIAKLEAEKAALDKPKTEE